MVLKIDLEKELKRIEEDSKIVQGFNTVTAVRTLLSRLDQLAHDDPVAAFESLDAFDQKSKDGDSWDTLTANPELREKIKYDDEVGHNFEYLILKDEGNRLKITIDRKKANKDRENRSRIKKYKLARTVKITAVVITIIAVIVAFALYIYPTYIEERPIESISIDIPSEIQAGIEYSCPITILPTNASDKTLCLEYEDKDITANIEREKLNILLNDFVEDGKRIKLVVESEKYKTAYKELNLIAINDLTMDLEPSSNKASLGEIVTINVSFNRSVNPEMVWTCDNPNIELTPKGNNIEAYIKFEGWDEKDTKVSITGAVKNTTYSKTVDVMISTEFELSFKTAPTSLNIGESYLMEINLPIGYDATKITWNMVSQDGVTLRNSTGISNTLEIKSGAVLGNNVKIIVSAAGIAKTAIWEKKINNTIIVRNEAQLKLMSNYPTATFELYDDLRINNWTPINFNGNLDGKYQKIIISYNGTPTTTNSIGEKSYGLFNKLNGNISNLYIEWNQLVANTNGNLYVGGLAGQILGGSIKEVFISGTIQVNKKTGTDSSYIGGLVGLCSGTVTIAECTSAIKITSYGEWSMCGGIVGAARASSDCIITKCIFSGSIDAIAGETPGPAWDSCAGGIVGELGDSSEKGSITISKCLSKSPRINGEGQWVYCAGILGWGRNGMATISDCGVLKDTITGKNTIPMGWLVGSGLYIENIYCTQNGSASITTSGVCKVYDNIEDMPKYQDEYVALITPLPAEI